MDNIDLGKESHKPSVRKIDTLEAMVSEILRIVKRIETEVKKEPRFGH